MIAADRATLAWAVAWERATALAARLRPLLRREPLPHRPLVVAAAALAAGCVAARLAGRLSTPRSTAFAWWCCGCVALAAWWLCRRRGLSMLATATLWAAVACGGAVWSAARFDLFPGDDLAWRLGTAPVPVAVRGTIVESFRQLPSPAHDAGRAAAIGPSSECVVAVESARVGSRWIRASGLCAMIVAGPPPDVVSGTRVRVLGRGLRPAPALNPGDADPRSRARGQRTLSIVRVDSAACIRVLERPSAWSAAAALDRLRERGVAVLQRHVGPARGPLAAALLLGARDSLPRGESDDFLVTGTVHVLSISGLHVGLMAAALFAAFRALAVPRPAALAAVAGCTGMYMPLVGAETPVVRATLLVWLACLAAATGRHAAAVNGLAAAAIVVLAWRPAEVFSAGAQLSFLSTAVLVGVAAALPRAVAPNDPIDRLIDRSRSAPERWLRRRAWQVWVLFVCGLAVWAATGPLVASRFPVVSPVGLVLNVLIAPLVAVAMAAGFLCLLAAPLPEALAGCCGVACDAALAAIAGLVDLGARIPGGHAWLPGPPAWWTVGWYAVLAAALCLLAPERLARGRTWAFVAAAWAGVGLVGVGASRAAWRPACGMRAVVADLGHGCGIVVRSPTGRRLLFDAGRLGAPAAARRSVAAVLWSEGVSRIDVLAISHADADHLNGMPDLLDRFAVGEVVLPEAFLASDAPTASHLRRRFRERGVAVRTLAAGDSIALDPLCRLRALHPPPGPTPAGTPDNESGLVLSVESAGRRFLLTGDLEGPALERFVRAGPGECDVVVAPHHGSRSSLPAGLAAATRPSCVIASGADGASWPEVRAAYVEAGGGCEAFITGGGGALAVEFSASAVTVDRFVDRRWRREFPPPPAAVAATAASP
ncbi:MAG: ComEC/Rec2 family competence protein [Planctomycetaceae bacterium]